MKRKCLLVCVALVLLLSFMSGCAMSQEEYLQEGNALVIIVGNHANANRYDEQIVLKNIRPLLNDAVTRRIEGEDYIATLNVKIIVSDGNPTVANIALGGYDVELVAEAKSIEKSLRDIEDMIEDVEDFLLVGDLRADDPEVDLLSAISEAARILRLNPGVENHIFIYDTGIVTSGKMSMGVGENQLDIQAGTIEEVMARLHEGMFPDLNGINVEFHGLGDVCIGQKDMRQYGAADFEDRLVAFWEKFFDICGANLRNKLVYAPNGQSPMLWDTEVDPYPFVRNVPFYDTHVQNGGEQDNSAPILIQVNLTASELGGFKGDSDEFKNEEQARQALNSYYNSVLWRIAEDPSLKLYVVGSCAMTSPDDAYTDRHVSSIRALAVSELIQKQFGISADQIIEIDAGTQRFSWSSTAKEFPNGKWPVDTAAQAEHRVVSLIPATENNASLIQELLDAGETDIRP